MRKFVSTHRKRWILFIIMFIIALCVIVPYDGTRNELTLTTIKSLRSSSDASGSGSAPCNSLINSIQNTIFDSKLCGNLILKSDDDSNSYFEAKSQFASVSHPENVDPSVVVFAGCDEDIKLTFEYAKQCNFKVVIRSGGHQYSGLSSCNSAVHPCIQLDMRAFDTISITKNSKIVELGVGAKLGHVSQVLAASDLFVPHGDCQTVAVGGHFSTGGQGHMHMQLGTFLSHVIGYDFMTVNGSFVAVDYNKKKSSWDALSTIVNRAVKSGQNSGNWGVVTKVRIEALQNSDFPMSIYYTCDWQFDGDVLKSMLYVFKEMYESDQIDRQYSFYLRILKGGVYGEIIRFIANFIRITGETLPHDIYAPFNKFIDAANRYSTDAVICNPIQMTPSEYQLSASVPYIFAQKTYLHRMHLSPYRLHPMIRLSISDGFIHSFTTQFAIIYEEKAKYAGVYMYAEITYGSGGDRRFLQIGTDIYWNQSINPNGRRIVSQFSDSTWTKLLNTWTFGFGWIDIRSRGSTFGNVNIEDVWQHYFHWNVESYHKSQKLKRILDPLNIISNSFTVKPFGMTKTKKDFQTHVFNYFQNSIKLEDFLLNAMFISAFFTIGCTITICWYCGNRKCARFSLPKKNT